MIQQRNSTVYIIDDDPRIGEALEQLLAASGLRSLIFHSIGAYLNHSRVDGPACIVLDVELPDINGLDFQKQMDDSQPPVVFITGHGDIPSSVRAMRRGAVDFLAKPFSATDLLAAIEIAIQRDEDARTRRAELDAIRARYASLTPRECEALPLIVSGLLNKQAAAELGISDATMQIHRSKIMQKMGAASLADLVRVAGRLQIPIEYSRRRRMSPP